MTVTADWSTIDTSEFRSAFGDAQARLDDLNFGDCYLNEEACSLTDHRYTEEMAAADRKIADRYERLVLQPAHTEFERQCDEDEFARHFPEPANDARIEWEGRDGKWFGAYRVDDAEGQATGTWYLYGENGAYTWRSLVGEFEIHMESLTLLVPAPGGES